MKKKIFILIGIIGLLLIVAGVGINQFGTKQEKNNTNDESTEEKEVKKDGMNNGVADSNYYKKNEDGTLTNTSKKIKEVHTNGDFSIENMTINYSEEDEYLANYSYEIKNNGTTNYNSVEFSIIFVYSDGTKRDCPSAKVENFVAGQSIKLDRQNLFNIIGASDYEIKIISSN